MSYRLEPSALPDADAGARFAVENRDPKPGFESPFETEATVTFAPRSKEGGNAIAARIYVGRYEARAVPIADTYAGGPLTNAAKLAPGTYLFNVQAPGYGHYRFTRAVAAGQTVTLDIAMSRNYASGRLGATATSTGGVNSARLIDDTESTNFARLDNGTPIRGATVTVDLEGTTPKPVTSVQVSALLRGQDADDQGDPQGAGDTEAQNRFTSLRQFEILACTKTATRACVLDTDYTRIYTSLADAFPAGRPRPVAPDMVIKRFDVTDTTATHVRLRVLTNQCTGAPAYQGDQDADPTNDSGCLTSSSSRKVRVAELQVFGTTSSVGP